MSAANVLASFGNKHLPAACAAGASAAGLTWPADEDVFSDVVPEGLSCRLHQLDEGPGDHESVTLVQVSLRIPLADLDDWGFSRFRAAFRKKLNFSSTSATPRLASLPAFDYEQSDNPSVAVGTFRLEQAGSRFWRMGWDGPGVRLLMVHLNLFNQSD